jgi:pantoate--beta-alanine ligase
MASLKATETVAVETTSEGLRRWTAQRRRAGERIALVPTMGALHEGHLTLARIAAQRADRVVVSIFVNPAQFAPGEDFARYPRSEEADLAMLAEIGVDLAYLPAQDAMYPAKFSTAVDVGGPLTATLEATIRPGHFTGVATVVAKLLLQAAPDLAAFGEKDYQQLQVIRRLVADLDIPVEILPVPTVRDSAGLALSSRNAYLSADELTIARRLNRILAATADRLRQGANAATASLEATKALMETGFTAVDYVTLADPETLAPLERLDRPGRLLAAARIGKTRLIDNIAVAPR